mmetsp:Transcript_23774/g.70341  ORF Transcript_23774/g.70341 Transcript_23774/m.70341 type:complete len:256 (+) Transcript_23774:4910-5677(+)
MLPPLRGACTAAMTRSSTPRCRRMSWRDACGSPSRVNGSELSETVTKRMSSPSTLLNALGSPPHSAPARPLRGLRGRLRSLAEPPCPFACLPTKARMDRIQWSHCTQSVACASGTTCTLKTLSSLLACVATSRPATSSFCAGSVVGACLADAAAATADISEMLGRRSITASSAKSTHRPVCTCLSRKRLSVLMAPAAELDMGTSSKRPRRSATASPGAKPIIPSGRSEPSSPSASSTARARPEGPCATHTRPPHS